MAFHLFFFLLLVLPACLSSSIPSPDIPALLAFKSASSDPVAALASWALPSDPCSGSWRGISCVLSSPPRVHRVVLEGLRLAGDIAAVAALAQLPFLSLLSLKNNSFAGPLHSIGFSPLAPHLKLLYLSGNRFSGRFPESVLHLRHLHRLDLSGNHLTGVIPPEIGHCLPALLTLRLARNMFVGPVPASLGAITRLAELNVAGNHLKGEIPRHLAATFPASSFAGNPDLCGDPLPHRCNDQHQLVYVGSETAQRSRRRTNHDRWKVVMIVAAVSTVAATLVAAALGTAVWFKNKKVSTQTGPRTTSMAREETVRFDGCCAEFDVSMLMRGAAEMLGKGAAGTTYRVVIGGDSVHEAEAEEAGEVVVVKRMRRREGGGGGGGGGKEEERRRRELVKEMGTWRHANIVSLRAFYASPEELLLVFDYLPNGSLHSLLHDNRGPARIPLDWHTRLKLAQDAARGLAFLHGVSESKFSHQHLTSSNILVDADGNARVSDFSLLELLAPTSGGEASQKQDVYSFGVVLLEILTGRSPEDGKVDLPRQVRTMVQEEWTSEVFDVELLRCRGAEDEMVALLQVALLCIADELRDRPKMTVVSKMIEDIRDRGSKRSKYSASPSQVAHSYESSPCISEDTTTASSS